MVVKTLSKSEKRFFDLAKEVSKTSKYHGTHVGCCVVYRGVVVSVGVNCEKTHPLQKEFNKYRGFNNPKETKDKLHAEIHALSLLLHSKLDIDWSKVSIYTYRELKNGRPAMSRPCKGCGKLIKILGIPYVYYIDREGNMVKEKW